MSKHARSICTFCLSAEKTFFLPHPTMAGVRGLPNALLQHIDEAYVHDCESVGITRAAPNAPHCPANHVPVDTFNTLTTPTMRYPVCCRPLDNFASYTRAKDNNMTGLARSILRSITIPEARGQNVDNSLIATQGAGADMRRFDVVRALLDKFQGPAVFSPHAWSAAIHRPSILQNMLQIVDTTDPNQLGISRRNQLLHQCDSMVGVSPLTTNSMWRIVDETRKVPIEGCSAILAVELAKVTQANVCVRVKAIDPSLPDDPGLCILTGGRLVEHVPFPAMSILIDRGALQNVSTVVQDRTRTIQTLERFVRSAQPCDIRVVETLAGVLLPSDTDRSYVCALSRKETEVASMLIAMRRQRSQTMQLDVRSVIVFELLSRRNGTEESIYNALRTIFQEFDKATVNCDDVVLIVGSCLRYETHGLLIFQNILQNCAFGSLSKAMREICMRRVIIEYVAKQEPEYSRFLEILHALRDWLDVRSISLTREDLLRIFPFPTTRVSAHTFPISVQQGAEL